MSPAAERLLAAALVAAIAGCGGDPATPDAGGATRDAGLDARVDPPRDAGADAGTVQDAAVACPSSERDLWVWDDAVVTDPAATDALFAFAAERDIRAVYVEGGALVMRDDDALQAFVAAAAERCLIVDLLFGDPSWARASEHDALLALIDRTVTVTAAASARPRGVHLDVEPYALPEWMTDRDAIARDFVDLLRAVAAALDGSGLELTVDVPFWFDEISIDPGGGARPLSEIVQEVADRTVIMAYRDHAGLPAGLDVLSQEELTHASAIGRPLVIGVETQCDLEPEYVTFCEEGDAVLEAELASARAGLVAAPGFGGFAIHHYGSYRELRP